MGYFNEEHSLFRESLREFLEREVRPNIEDWEKAGKIPKSIEITFNLKSSSSNKALVKKI